MRSEAQPVSARSDAATFAVNKYAVLPCLVKNPTLASCHKYALRMAESGALQPSAQTPSALVRYGDPMMEMLLEKLAPDIERATAFCSIPLTHASGSTGAATRSKNTRTGRRAKSA